jgi:hypothetical protein
MENLKTSPVMSLECVSLIITAHLMNLNVLPIPISDRVEVGPLSESCAATANRRGRCMKLAH